MKVTNYTKATQGVRVDGQLVFVKSGEEKELKVSGDEANEVKNHPAFQKDGRVPVILADTEPYTDAQDKPLEQVGEEEETEEEKEEEVKDVDEKDELIAQLAELEVQADRRSSVATLTAKLEEAKAAQ
jgi:hypothetical protein